MYSKLKKLAANYALARRCSEIDNVINLCLDEPSYRNKFMRDRDRILYCKSFLRLAGKTQVYAPSKGDHQRTRLTHTLEVSQIARTISKALFLDSDLTEAIALGHDIGHTPFGHAGERMLHEIMSPINNEFAQVPKSTSLYKLKKSRQATLKEYYGFKHNLQSVRCVLKDLESRDVEFGLNLTNYTLWGIMNHSGLSYKPGRVSTDYVEADFYKQYYKYCYHPDGSPAWSFEGLIVREADEIAQMHHDLEDAIRSKSIPNEKVIELVNTLSQLMTPKNQYTLATLSDVKSKEHFISEISTIVVNTLVTTFVSASRENLIYFLNIERDNVDNIFERDVYEDEHIKSAISYDVYGENKNKDLVLNFKSALSTIVLYTYDVQRSDSKGKYIIKNLFEAYYTNPQQLPDSAIRNFRKATGNFSDDDYVNTGTMRSEFEEYINDFRMHDNVEEDLKLMRTICDYIAGMTDNFAISEYEKLYG